MMRTIKVVAATANPVPRADNPHRYIKPGDAPAEVPENAYYLRRMADGELKLAPDAPASDSQKGGK